MAILGAVLGDIIGAQYEFNRPKNLDWKNVPLLGEYGVGFTDDSVMALAIKKALDEGLDLVETMVDVGRRYPFCGYGGNFYHWIYGEEHRPYGSWGNGSAMRVAYVGEFYDDYEKMQEAAAKTAKVSHDHPEGIKGAVVTSTCIWMARHGKSKEEIYDYVSHSIRRKCILLVLIKIWNIFVSTINGQKNVLIRCLQPCGAFMRAGTMNLL